MNHNVMRNQIAEMIQKKLLFNEETAQAALSTHTSQQNGWITFEAKAMGNFNFSDRFNAFIIRRMTCRYDAMGSEQGHSLEANLLQQKRKQIVLPSIINDPKMETALDIIYSAYLQGNIEVIYNLIETLPFNDQGWIENEQSNLNATEVLALQENLDKILATQQDLDRPPLIESPATSKEVALENTMNTSNLSQVPDFQKSNISNTTTQDIVIILPMSSPYGMGNVKIEKDNSVYFEAYDTRVKFDPLHMAVYLFYLLNEEGVAIADWYKHKTEILHIYSQITKRSESENAKKSIQKLLERGSNAPYEKVSRIKKIITNALGEINAKPYLINKAKVGKKKWIPFNRNFLDWDSRDKFII